MTEDQPISPEKQWQNFCNAMADVEDTLSDEEILAEVRADGEDPSQVAERVRKVLMEAVHKAQRQKLNTEAEQNIHVFPPTAEARRALLGAILTKQPALQTAILSVHHRELTTLTDSDVEAYLEDLAALGMLDDSDQTSSQSA